ncbi:MAG: pyridoxamine 5'-phosphate oxidase family protein [Pseudomonadota bacterium]
MAKIARALRLTDQEIDHLLGHEPRLRIATIGPGADINLTPMTFGWAGGRIYIYARGQKVANLRRSPNATVLVDVGEAWRELQGIMLRGEARVLETPADEEADPHLAEAQRNLGRKHGLTDEAGADQPHAPSAAGNSRRWVVFSPTTVVSWDNSKLP